NYFGRIDPPMLEVLRLRQGEVDLPIDGGNDTIRASTLWDVEDDGRLSVRHGDSFIMFAEWDEAGKVTSRSIQPFGSATTRPDSPHYTDQMKLFVEKSSSRSGSIRRYWKRTRRARKSSGQSTSRASNALNNKACDPLIRSHA